MATKQLYATGTFKFQNRMLKADDPVEMDAPTARLYAALGKVTEAKPRGATAAKKAAPKRRRKAKK